MRKSNKSVYLNLMIAGVLSHEPLSAWAQAPATTEDEEAQKSSQRAPASMSVSKDEVLEEIVVRGVIYSILNSQRIKRDADSIVDAVTAEDLGKFTDQNVAEALARVPGVQIQRANGGEGTQISVRGLGPELNRYLINGRTAFTGDTRAFDFSTLPAELVASATVIKTPTADIDEGGLGAVVEVKTRRPLDLDGTNVAMTLQDQFNALGDDHGPRVSVLAGDTFADDTLGLLISGAYNENVARQDYIQGYGWSRVTANMFSNPAIAVPGAFRQTTITPALDDGQRTRSAVSAVLQWRPADGVEATLDVLHTDLKDNHERIQLTPQFQNTFPDDYSVYGGGITAVGVDDTNTINYLEAQNLNLTAQNIVLEDRVKTDSVGATLDWALDKWSLKGDVAYSKATRENLFGNIAFGGRFDVRYDARGGGVPTIDYFAMDPANVSSINSGAPVSTNDPGVYLSQGVQGNINDVDQDEGSIKFAAERAIASQWLTGIKMGGGYRTSDYSNDFYIQNVFDLYAPNGPFSPFVLSSTPAVMRPFPVNDFAPHTSGSFPRTWVNFDFNQALALMEVSPTVGADFLGTLPKSPAGSYRVAEDVSFLYGRADFAGQLFGAEYTGNIGIRGAYTEEDVQGFGPNRGGVPQAVSASANYFDPLPSANINFSLRDDLNLRLAAARVITRPQYEDLNPGFVIRDINNLTAAAGNPNLDPFRANQLDITLEYYGDKGVSAVAGLFYKDVKSFITRSTLPGTLPGYVGTFQITRPVNGEGAKIKGAEVAANIPIAVFSDVLNGLGFTFNYTYVDSDASYVNGLTQFSTPMEGLSKDSYNVGAYYERQGLSMNVVYNWRSKYVYSAVGAESNTEWARPQGYLYASVSYDFNEHVGLSLQGYNLTNEKFELYSDIPDRLRFIAETGRGGIFGVRVKF